MGEGANMSHLAAETIFLATAHFIAGIMGFFYRVFLSRNLGSEGMGIYQQVLSFYSTTITLMTAGIPLAVSKLIAESQGSKDQDKGNEIVISAVSLTISFSIVGTVFLIFLSAVLERPVLLIILPAAVFVGFSSVLKGYFLGLQNTMPIRWSILAESLARTFFGVIVIESLILAGLEGKTKGAVTALAVGELISLFVLSAFYKRSAGSFGKIRAKVKNIKSILSIAIPVSMSQIVGSLSGSLEALLVPKSLELSGLSSSIALGIYGKTAGMVLPLLFFPALFTMSLSSNIIPRVAAAMSRKNTDYAFRLSEQALAMTILFCFAITSFFMILAKPIADVLFPGFSLEYLIKGFSAGIPFFFTEHVLLALLRGIGNNAVPLINSVTSFIITNVLTFVLVSRPHFGIYGYSLALMTASAASIAVSLHYLEKNFQRQFDIAKIVVKPMFCGLFMAFILNHTYLPLKSLGMSDIVCIGADFLLGATGFLALAMALGMNIKNYNIK